MSFDLIRYREHKELGLIKIERKDDKTVAICKQFDRFTGDKMDDAIVEIDTNIKSQLMNLKATNLRVNEEVDALISDISDIEKQE